MPGDVANADEQEARVVSAILGHATPGFTLNVYRHVIDEMTAPAAYALDRWLR